VALTGEQIEQRLRDFVARWRDEQGSERSEAQTFLNELLDCYGTDRKSAGVRFEDYGGGGFKDMIWPGVCIVEMKRESEKDKLEQHRPQAFRYWMEESRKTGHAGRYVVLCAFKRFEIFEPRSFWDRPITTFDLDDLPDRREALDFLRGREPRFAEDRAELTRGAVAHVTDLYNRLGDRGEGGADVRRAFLLQSVWCMFAEDLGLIPDRRFSRAVEQLVDDPGRSSFDDLGTLFRWLNTPGARPTSGVAEGVPYVDGGLFREPALVELNPEERELLREACGFNWAHVEPAIFGSLLEGALGRDRVWALGAHYTSEADIRKVVEPTIVEPWRARIEACESLDDVREARDALTQFTVLDPACGSGNFLYVAYRELRLIEVSLNAVERRLREEGGLPPSRPEPGFHLTNIHGIELEPFAVELARVTLLMGHARAAYELDLGDEVLPLPTLTQIRRADALKVEWPRADAIIGNPPYHGSQRIRAELGDDYAEWLKREFGIGLKDYAVYWFRKAHQALPNGGRGGLVATNSVSQGRSREVSLEWILENGGVITNAVSSQPWSGAAKVHVSIVNWVKDPRGPVAFQLDERPVTGITASLREGTRRPTPGTLAANLGIAYQGVIPAGMGFIVDEEEASRLLADVSAEYGVVVRRYLMGDDIVDDPAQEPRRWILDFGLMPLEEARKWPAALKIVEERVRPKRSRNRRKIYRERWWAFAEPRPAMRAKLTGLSRYLGANRVGKRLLFTWADATWCPGDKVVVFARTDDFTLGVLSSSLHTAWAWALSSTLKADLNYTPTSAVETFPWPQPTDEQREMVARAARNVITRRQEICLEREIGLTRLYNEVDEGAYADLERLHERLDEAVAAAYGWPKSAAHDPVESNRRLLELNRAIAAGEIEYSPFA
jgi:hypothetical protein